METLVKEDHVHNERARRVRVIEKGDHVQLGKAKRKKKTKKNKMLTSQLSQLR